MIIQTAWCEFFLKAVETQAKATEILNLYENKKKQIVDRTRSQYAIYTLDFIFSRPIFNSKDFSGMGEEIPATTSKRILNILLETEVLTIVRESSGRKPSIYAFPELINTAEGKAVF